MAEENRPIVPVGYGQLKNIKGRLSYVGTLPFEKDEELLVIRKSDLEAILTNELNSLLTLSYDLPKGMYTPKEVDEDGWGDCGGCISLPDEIDIERQGQEYKLFLDRHFYSHNPRDAIWIRYVSIDQSLMEEDGGLFG